jgi:hypothetical protein
MTVAPRGPTRAGGAAEAWDLLTWHGTPTPEETENAERYGLAQPPTVLAFGVTLDGEQLRAEIVTVTRNLREADRVVTLHRVDGRSRTARVRWNDCLRPARWGDATFQII